MAIRAANLSFIFDSPRWRLHAGVFLCPRMMPNSWRNRDSSVLDHTRGGQIGGASVSQIRPQRRALGEVASRFQGVHGVRMRDSGCALLPPLALFVIPAKSHNLLIQEQERRDVRSD